MRLAIVAVVLACSCRPIWVMAQDRARPCVNATSSAVLRPVDEGSRRADFQAFRRDLLTVVARRDERDFLRVVDPSVKVGFDGSDGRVAFQEQHLHNPDEDFWTEFAAILGWGGRFAGRDAFTAPYVFSNWPDGFDSFECLAVVGSRVRVRRRPDLTAPIVAMVDYAIVEQRTDPSETSSRSWQRVRLADGREGYIARTLLRSPVDHRAFFEFKNGQWWLVTYLAGD